MKKPTTRMAQRIGRGLRNASSIALMSCAVSAAYAGPFSNIFVLGDSLSDAGSYTSLTGSAVLNNFTNAGAPVWNEILAAKYGLSISTYYDLAAGPGATFDNGTIADNNFAVGGARVNLQPGVLTGLPAIAANIPPVSTQIDRLLTHRPSLDPKAVYFVWAGANDLFTALGTPATAAAAMATAAASLGTQVARLTAAGAKTVVVMGLPDVGATPFGVASGSGATITQLTQAYNGAVQAALVGKNVLYFDMFAVTQKLLAVKERFGITSSSVPACGASSSLGCAAATNGAFYADGVHPSGLGHQLIADYFEAVLAALGAATTGTSISQAAAPAPRGKSGAEWRTVGGRTRSFQNFGYSGKGARVFFAGDYADSEAMNPNGNRAGDGRTVTATVGVEGMLTPKTLLGATLGQEFASFDVVGGLGSMRFRETMLTGFLSHKLTENWYVNGLVSAGFVSFDTSRNVLLGGVLLGTEKADFGGQHFGAKVQTGYQFRTGTLVHGPFFGADWERINVNAFRESEVSGLGIETDKQTNNIAHWRVGYEVAGEATWGSFNVRPYLQGSYDNQYLKDERTVRSGMAGTGLMLPIAVENKTGGFGRLAVGFSTKVGASQGELSVGLSSSFDNPSGDDTALNVQYSLPM